MVYEQVSKLEATIQDGLWGGNRLIIDFGEVKFLSKPRTPKARLLE